MRIRPGDVTAGPERALLDDYFAFRAAAFPSDGGPYTVSYPSPVDFDGVNGVFLVVDDDEGVPVGCGGIRMLADADAGVVRFEVKHVWLSPAARGRGWAGALMDELEHRARAFGATELVLDTHDTLDGAARLYTRLGYEQIPAYNTNPNATRWYRKLL
ncbi:GNAT family N-acetyltransferase [Herbiconiux sp. UC225_62]|uniref:GNAT family N-acetyltransferase n=1 Tax=Herbiconiux sp. UC225_62 TaxID=3350168 RepID=UPI0036D27965